MESEKTYRKIHMFISLVALSCLLCASQGCSRCYECTGQTEFGETTQEICGRKKNIEPYVKVLTTDSANPWTCVKT